MMAGGTVFSRRLSAIFRPRGPLYLRRLHARLVVGINTAGTYSFVVSEAAVERGIYVVSVTEN